MKKRVTVSISSDLLVWVDRMIVKKIFASKSHAVDFSLHHTRSTHPLLG